MKKKVFLLFAALLFSQFAFAYNFSSTAPSGQVLYYKIRSDELSVIVVSPSTYPNPWGGYSKPTGILIIPDRVTYGGKSYSVTGTGYAVFYECTELISVTIPNSITYINAYAFYGCSGLTSVTIGNSVTSINEYAFWGCTGMTSMEFLGQMPPQIGTDAFTGIPTDIPIYIPRGSLAYYTAQMPQFSNFIERQNGGTEGIIEIGEDDIRISVLDRCIFVEGITNEEVRVYDIKGRMVQNRSLLSGVYIVKIGTLPAQKVVVMR